jgi:hypothetical protein
MEAMHQANLFGWALVLIAMLVATVGIVIALRARRFALAGAILLLLVLHGGWWLSAYRGDCGSSRVGVSLWDTQTIALLTLLAGAGAGTRTWPWRGVLLVLLFVAAAQATAFFSVLWFPLEAVLVSVPVLFAGWWSVTEWLIGRRLADVVRAQVLLSGVERRALFLSAVVGLPLVVMFLLGTMASMIDALRGASSGLILHDFRYAVSRLDRSG